MSAPQPLAIHATAVVIGETGVLIRGPSGAGKSALALALVEEGRRAGAFARLVGDDRVLVTCANARLLLRPHPRIAGQVERRGEGVCAAPHEPAVVLRCVIDIAPEAAPPPRMPAPGEQAVAIAGVNVPRLALLGVRPVEAARLVFDFLKRLPR